MQGFPVPLVLGFALAGALALGAIVAIPGGGDRPPESTLVAVALVVAVVMGAAVYAGVRFELGLPVSIAAYALAYNALVVPVKLWLGPEALYRASQEGRVTADLGTDDTAATSASCVRRASRSALGEPAPAPFAAAFAAGIAWMLVRLLRAEPGRDEQVAIGLGARLGNGLLVGVLAWLVLAGDGAPAAHRLGAPAAVAFAFGGGFLVLARRPQAVALGYKV